MPKDTVTEHDSKPKDKKQSTPAKTTFTAKLIKSLIFFTAFLFLCAVVFLLYRKFFNSKRPLIPEDGENKKAIKENDSKTPKGSKSKLSSASLTQNKQQLPGNSSTDPITILRGPITVSNGENDSGLEIHRLPNGQMLAKFNRLSGSQGTFVRLYSSDLTPLSAPQMAANFSSSFSESKLLPTPDGGFALFTMDDQLYVQKFDSALQPESSRLKINSYDITGTRCFDVGIFTDGTFVANWNNDDYTSIGKGVRGQYLYPSGTRSGIEFLASETDQSTYIQCPVRVNVRADNYYLTSWSWGSTAWKDQLFTSSRDKTGSVNLNAVPPGNGMSAFRSATLNTPDGFAQVYSRLASGTNNAQIYVQKLSESGAFTGPTLDVGGRTYQGLITKHDIATVTCGNAVAVFVPEEPGNFIYLSYLKEPEHTQLAPLFNVDTNYATRTEVTLSPQDWNRFVVGVTEQRNTTTTATLLYELMADGMKPVVTKSQVAIPEPGANVTLSSANFDGVDPDGPEESLLFDLPVSHGQYRFKGSNTATTQCIKSDIDSGKVYFQHDGSHYTSEGTVTATDVSSLKSEPVKVSFSLFDPNGIPIVKNKVLDVGLLPWHRQTLDFSNVFSVGERDTLVMQLEAEGHTELSEWIKFNGTAADLWPPDPVPTIQLKLTGTSVRPEGTNTSATDYFYVQQAEVPQQNGSKEQTAWDKFKVWFPIMGSSLSCASGVAVCGASTLTGIGLYRKRERKRIANSRKLNDFARIIWENIGKPEESKNFDNARGRAFIAVITGPLDLHNPIYKPYEDDNNVLGALGISVPTNPKDTKRLAEKIAHIIKKTVKPRRRTMLFWQHGSIHVVDILNSLQEIKELFLDKDSRVRITLEGDEERNAGYSYAHDVELVTMEESISESLSSHDGSEIFDIVTVNPSEFDNSDGHQQPPNGNSPWMQPLLKDDNDVVIQMGPPPTFARPSQEQHCIIL